jgi:bacterioferritin-associated ferredoxin
MKVRVEVTVDIDADAWCLCYGIDPGEVRADVKQHLAESIRQHVIGLGVAAQPGG